MSGEGKRFSEGQKKLWKKLKKTLDNHPKIWYNEYVKRKDTSQTRKANAMKKSSLSAVYSALKGIDFDSEILAEVEKELNKGEAQKAKNAEAYEAMHDVIVGTLSDVPVTCGELYESIKDELPEGATKGKVQYALTHLWQDEIVKIEGKPNTYRRA